MKGCSRVLLPGLIRHLHCPLHSPAVAIGLSQFDLHILRESSSGIQGGREARWHGFATGKKAWEAVLLLKKIITTAAYPFLPYVAILTHAGNEPCGGVANSMLFHQGQAFFVVGWLPDIASCLVQSPPESPAIESYWSIAIAKVSSRALCRPLKELLSALCACCID